MRKKLSKILILCILIMFLLTNTSFAQVEIFVPEKTEAYEHWESLTPEEKEETTEPKYYSLGIKQSLRRSQYNTLLAGNSSLDRVYNLSELYTTIVKDQKYTGACWAFATTSMLESTAAVRNKLLGKEYSPMHMEYMGYQMYKKELGYGGNITMAMAIMANGRGPVLESDFPMESVYDMENNSINNYFLTDIENVDLNKKAQLKINKTTDFPMICKEYDSETGEITYTDGIETTYTIDEVNVAREKIKSHIQNYGAVVASMYVDFETTSTSDFTSNYYDKTSNTYCCTDSSDATIMNHEVAIVGWDDNKSAYIVQNSYGEAFGDGGYFYVSYDDVRIEENIYGINDMEDISQNNTYDNIYQYDELGMNYALVFTTPEAYYANVFSRDSSVTDKDEYINEVGLYIFDTTGIEIYVNAADGEFVDENNNSKLKLVHSGEILEPGYHVIKLNATEDTKLTGEEFIVAVKSINQEGAILPIESNLYDSKFTFVSNMYDTAVANEGESLYSTDGITWNELNGTKVGFIETLENTNACVRAFTKYTTKPKDIAVTGVQLDKDSITLTEGETENITATVLPENATNKNVNWESSNEEVATIANGVITALNAGETTITVKTEDGNYTDTCKVVVEPKVINVTGITLTPETVNIKEEETATLTATVLPENATNKNVTWTSSNEEVATVLNGVVTGVKSGTAVITVKTVEGNYTKTCTVTVEENNPVEVKVTGVNLNKTSGKLKIGETLSLTPTISPSNATNQNVAWESSNESVATVANGVVTALKEGTTRITVRTEDGNFTDICTITVEKDVINVTGVEITVSSVELEVGTTIELFAEISPSNATNKNITWESSNEEVAKIVNGVINTLKPGTATITVRTEDGNFTDTCILTVKENSVVKVEGIKLNKQELQMEVSDKATLIVTFNPELPTNTNIKWESSNTKVATVDQNGIVTAVGKGEAVITATSEDGGYVAKATVTVTKQVDDPDDIYKEPENNNKEPEEDTSASDKPLPNTGIKTMVFMIATAIIAIMGYSFIRYRRLRDVK